MHAPPHPGAPRVPPASPNGAYAEPRPYRDPAEKESQLTAGAKLRSCTHPRATGASVGRCTLRTSGGASRPSQAGSAAGRPLDDACFWHDRPADLPCLSSIITNGRRRRAPPSACAATAFPSRRARPRRSPAMASPSPVVARARRRRSRQASPRRHAHVAAWRRPFRTGDGACRPASVAHRPRRWATAVAINPPRGRIDDAARAGHPRAPFRCSRHELHALQRTLSVSARPTRSRPPRPRVRACSLKAWRPHDGRKRRLPCGSPSFPPGDDPSRTTATRI